MSDIITREVSSGDLKELVNKLIPDSMSVDITKACQGIYPLHDVHIRKVLKQKDVILCTFENCNLINNHN